MSDEPRKLPKQPLTLVLAEFRYSNVLKIEGYIPGIQERIRKEYPVLKQGIQQSVMVADQAISAHTTSQWLFTSQNLRSTVLIGQDRLAYITSDYDRFPDFGERCFAVLEILKDVVDPSLLLRVGLRYNDHIALDNSEQLAKCVDSQSLPNDKFASLGTGVYQHRMETSIQTTEGLLVIRSLYGKHGLTVMPDLLLELPVKLNSKGDPDKGALILDFDHFWMAETPGIPFEPEQAKSRLDSLHVTARSAFWQATTEYARSNLWN